MLFEIIIRLFFIYAGIMAIRGKLNIGFLEGHRIKGFAFGSVIIAATIVDIYHTHFEGKFFQ